MRDVAQHSALVGSTRHEKQLQKNENDGEGFQLHRNRWKQQKKLDIREKHRSRHYDTEKRPARADAGNVVLIEQRPQQGTPYSADEVKPVERAPPDLLLKHGTKKIDTPHIEKKVKRQKRMSVVMKKHACDETPNLALQHLGADQRERVRDARRRQLNEKTRDIREYYRFDRAHSVTPHRRTASERGSTHSHVISVIKHILSPSIFEGTAEILAGPAQRQRQYRREKVPSPGG
jgi:hypothetical protein